MLPAQFELRDTYKISKNIQQNSEKHNIKYKTRVFLFSAKSLLDCATKVHGRHRDILGYRTNEFLEPLM